LNASKGCKKSSEDLQITTSQAAPEGLNAIEFKDVQYDDYFVNVHLKWNLPINSYGTLNLFEIKRNNTEIYVSKNMSILSYVDSKLDYGKNYTYQLTYFNDAGFCNVTNSHNTIQNFPKLIDKPQCILKTSNEISILFSDPIFPNGEIEVYEIKYKSSMETNWNKVNFLKKELKNSKNTVKITNLMPDNQYEFQVGICNLRGCTFTSLINDETCRTIESLPEGLMAPDCSDVSDINSNKMSILIKWARPFQPNGHVIDYTLYRSVFKKSISFENKLNEKTLTKNILYVGMNLSFIDYMVDPFCTYDYLVEVKTRTGSSLSPVSRITTRSILPMFLTKIGSVESFNNDSAILNLNPPIFLNGNLKNIFLLLNSVNYIKDILVYPPIDSEDIELLTKELTAHDLLNLLKQYKISHLKPKTRYEIKSKFCNEIGCLISDDKLFIQTLDNDKILEFNAVILTPNRVKFSWIFSYGVTESNTSLEYIFLIRFFKSNLI
jgi:hypothetical protein